MSVKTATPVTRVGPKTERRTALKEIFFMRADVVHVRIENHNRNRMERRRAGRRDKTFQKQTFMWVKPHAAYLKEQKNISRMVWKEQRTVILPNTGTRSTEASRCLNFGSGL